MKHAKLLSLMCVVSVYAQAVEWSTVGVVAAPVVAYSVGSGMINPKQPMTLKSRLAQAGSALTAYCALNAYRNGDTRAAGALGVASTAITVGGLWCRYKVNAARPVSGSGSHKRSPVDEATFRN